MKKMNSKQRKYYNKLSSFLQKKGFSKKEAKQTAEKTVETIMVTGNDKLLIQPKMMGRMILKEKKRVERGDVVKQKDGSLLDTKTGRVYKK